MIPANNTLPERRFSSPSGSACLRMNEVRQNLLRYGRSLVAFTLLLSFLSTIFLPSYYHKRLDRQDSKSVVFQSDAPRTLLTYLVDCCLELSENESDEEGDLADFFKLTKDYVTLGASTLHFNRFFLNEFAYCEIVIHWLGLPLQHFSPPPEK